MPREKMKSDLHKLKRCSRAANHLLEPWTIKPVRFLCLKLSAAAAHACLKQERSSMPKL
jgi:hypothetical protein